MLLLRDISTDLTTDVAGFITLPFERRRLSRQRARLDGGEEVALLLPRGTTLEEGSVLVADDGRRVRVRAAAEAVSRAETTDLCLLARAAYHLGNRHVPVQVEASRLSYLHDHVLDDLVRGLGLVVTSATAPFEPESGAYGGHGGHTSAHGRGHAHDVAHDHDHDHGVQHVPDQDHAVRHSDAHEHPHPLVHSHTERANPTADPKLEPA